MTCPPDPPTDGYLLGPRCLGSKWVLMSAGAISHSGLWLNWSDPIDIDSVTFKAITLSKRWTSHHCSNTDSWLATNYKREELKTSVGWGRGGGRKRRRDSEEAGGKRRVGEGGVSSKEGGKSGRGEQHPEADAACRHRYCSTAFHRTQNGPQSQRLEGAVKTHTDCGELETEQGREEEPPLEVSGWRTDSRTKPQLGSQSAIRGGQAKRFGGCTSPLGNRGSRDDGKISRKAKSCCRELAAPRVEYSSASTSPHWAPSISPLTSLPPFPY